MRHADDRMIGIARAHLRFEFTHHALSAHENDNARTERFDHLRGMARPAILQHRLGVLVVRGGTERDVTNRDAVYGEFEPT